MSNETVTIKLSEYERLLENEDWLKCLNAAGIDNWPGRDEAVDIREEMPFNFEEARNDINQ